MASYRGAMTLAVRLEDGYIWLFDSLPRRLVATTVTTYGYNTSFCTKVDFRTSRYHMNYHSGPTRLLVRLRTWVINVEELTLGLPEDCQKPPYYYAMPKWGLTLGSNTYWRAIRVRVGNTSSNLKLVYIHEGNSG